MSRFALPLTLLALFAVPLLGGAAMVSGCLEPCGDEADESCCPAVCVQCRSAQGSPAMTHPALSGQPPAASERYAREASADQAAPPPFEILHVPLAG